MDQQLTFSADERYSVPQFIRKSGNTKLDLIKSPKTGKHFMAGDSGTPIGGASESLISALAAGEKVTPVVSLVTTPEGVSFYLMHKTGEGNAPVISFNADGSIA